MADRLDLRDLNRALLARQRLLARTPSPPAAVARDVAGLQAQEPWLAPVGLLARSEVGREDVARAFDERSLVRATAMRGTLHVLAAEDLAALRPALAPALEAAFRGVAARRAPGLPVERVVADAREVLAEGPRTFGEIRSALAARHPGEDERVLGFCARLLVPLVQVPSGGPWGFPAEPAFALAERWLGRPLDGPSDPAALVRRHLAAFGPATARDVQAWSGVPGMRDAVAAIRDELVALRGPDGKELLDLPGAPLPGGDAPAPPRLLPGWDDALLAHVDRRRILPDALRPHVVRPGLRILPTLLVDGLVAGTWRVERARRAATLAVTAHVPVGRADRAAAEEEALRVLRFMEPGAAAHAVAWTAA